MTVKEIQSVRNACALLETLADDQPLGVSELSRRAGIDKSAAHRLAVTLHAAGWLHRTNDGRWRIAPALARLVTRASADSLVTIVHPLLETLRDSTGETAMLVAIERDALVVLDVADSRHALRITSPVGSELPIRNSSALRAIAAHSSPSELERLRRLDRGLDDRTLAETRRRGWAINDREITPDTRVVGAAVLGPEGQPLGALIVCAPTSRIDLRAMHRIGALVAETAEQASAAVAGRRAAHATSRSR